MRFLTKTFGAIACLSAIACCFSMPEAVMAKDPQPNCQSAQTQLDLNIWADLAVKAADRKLNETYQRLKTKYRNTNNAERLVDAQLAWISFRDRNCKFASERFQGGTIAPMIYSNCIERLTKQRTDELDRYFKGMESRDGL